MGTGTVVTTSSGDAKSALTSKSVAAIAKIPNVKEKLVVLESKVVGNATIAESNEKLESAVIEINEKATHMVPPEESSPQVAVVDARDTVLSQKSRLLKIIAGICFDNKVTGW
jgi:hypothetical protein